MAETQYQGKGEAGVPCPPCHSPAQGQRGCQASVPNAEAGDPELWLQRSGVGARPACVRALRCILGHVPKVGALCRKAASRAARGS